MAGEADPAGTELFASAPRRADLPQHDGQVVITTDGLSLMDHRGLAKLSSYSVACGVTTVVRARPGSSVALLAKLVDLPGVRVLAA